MVDGAGEHQLPALGHGHVLHLSHEHRQLAALRQAERRTSATCGAGRGVSRRIVAGVYHAVSEQDSGIGTGIETGELEKNQQTADGRKATLVYS